MLYPCLLSLNIFILNRNTSPLWDNWDLSVIKNGFLPSDASGTIHSLAVLFMEEIGQLKGH